MTALTMHLFLLVSTFSCLLLFHNLIGYVFQSLVSFVLCVVDNQFASLNQQNAQCTMCIMHIGSVLWIGFSLLLSCISHTHTFVPIILLVFGSICEFLIKLCLIHFSLACLLCLFCIYSFSSDVCNSNWKFDASKCERRFTTYYVFQGTRHYSIHRLSLGGNDYNASQGYSVMAFNSTLSWLFFHHLVLRCKMPQIWDKFSCNYVLMLCFASYKLRSITFKLPYLPEWKITLRSPLPI